MGMRSLGGDMVSEAVVAVDRVMLKLMESWAVEDVGSSRGDSPTSVDWGSEAAMGKIG